MQLRQQAKRYVLENVTRIPLPLGHVLMAVNRDPIRVYGRDYAAFRDRLRMTDKGYDNGPDVLRVVNTALAKVPYYRDRYGDRRVATLDEVRERIGFLDRSSVAEAAAQLVDPGLDPAQYDTCSTGGTSGPPLRLLAPKRRYVVEHATMHSLWERGPARPRPVSEAGLPRLP